MEVEAAAENSASSSSGGKMDHGTAVEEQGKDEDECALFATSMPRDVWANPSLAALAAMIDEDAEEKEKQVDGQEHSSSNDHQGAPREGGSSISDDGNEDGLAPPIQGAHSTTANQNGVRGGTALTSGSRHQRREDTRRRRTERRASPMARLLVGEYRENLNHRGEVVTGIEGQRRLRGKRRS